MDKLKLLELLKEVPDYRRGNAIKHNLHDVLMIGLLSVMCNGDTFTDMVMFAKTHENILREILELPHGIPSHDTFEDIFSKLNSRILSGCFQAWVAELNQTLCGAVIAIDGKTIRGSKSKDKKATHVVTAFASQAQLVLGQLSTDEKSNEITAIPELLNMLLLKGNTITIDAMGTQTEIASQIVENGGDYVLALKGNQGTLHEDISLYLNKDVINQETKGLKAQGEYFKTIEKGHGRIESRECFISTDIEWLVQKDKWSGLSGFGVIVSKRQEGEKEATVSHNYFIYSKNTATAEELLKTKRQHWAIENQLHWMLDVTFCEDACRARLENAAENLNIMRKQALQLMKQEKSKKLSMRSKRLLCSYDVFYAFLVVGANVSKIIS